MADLEKITKLGEELVGRILPLTDEETGEEKEFEVCEKAILDDQLYLALIPDDEESDEYVILKVTEDGDDLVFLTVDDDDEFEKIEDYFNDLLFSEVDYDEE